MLLVKAKAGVSKIHGLGLIAQDDIPAGTQVWVYQPGLDQMLTAEQIERLPEPARTFVRHYTFFDFTTRRYVLSGDDDRFTNHSDDPNTRCAEGFTYAVRDIRAGEEITNDYNEIGVSLITGTWVSEATANGAPDEHASPRGAETD